ncbi:universal stress protein [Sedimentitalea sp. CY04]|uniref:Universal stress protein n=1 Tax=Parasedimentitalea denitrificans TaxID=2211118 RepID=A0ABX0WBT6_9RHOB|nr:universal stress protein [Sedimentitalea sp. CY04]NIZ62112.1 universal stress protein [Sedimentitalea sp. CY04]
MLPKIQDILVATDLSENSDNALRYALSIAQASKANLHVLHVTEPLTQDAIVTMQMFMQDDASRKEAIKNRHGAIKQLLKANQKDFVKKLSAEEKDAYGLVGSVELVDGHPAEEILTRAKELDCGLIVMGTHEHGTGHTFLGTVVKRVLRRSNIPTMVVPHPL